MLIKHITQIKSLRLPRDKLLFFVSEGLMIYSFVEVREESRTVRNQKFLIM
jgi:hypothetical protein